MTKSRLSNKIIQTLDDTCHVWRRELRRILHDEGVVIFVIIVPLLYPLLYSWIYTNEVVREVPVAVVDNSHSQKSRQFIRDIDATPDVRIAYHCADMTEAEELIARQEVKGILYFPQDFSTKMHRGEQAHQPGAQGMAAEPFAGAARAVLRCAVPAAVLRQCRHAHRPDVL